MARAPALQAGGRGFEPHILHGCGRHVREDGSLTGWERHKKRKTSEKAKVKDAAVA